MFFGSCSCVFFLHSEALHTTWLWPTTAKCEYITLSPCLNILFRCLRCLCTLLICWQLAYIKTVRLSSIIKVKLSPRSNQSFICECIWVKPSCKSIITTKKKVSEQLTMVAVIFGVPQTKSVDPRVRPNREAWGAVHHYSPTLLRSHSGIDTFCLP